MASEQPMHFLPFQGPSIMRPTLLTPKMAVENSLATGMYELRHVSPYGSFALSWSPATAHALGDNITSAPI